MGLSPGVHCEAYAKKCNQKRAYSRTKSSQPSAKCRRLQLKMERSVTKGAKEALEGDTYQQGNNFKFLIFTVSKFSIIRDKQPNIL